MWYVDIYDPEKSQGNNYGYGRNGQELYVL